MLHDSNGKTRVKLVWFIDDPSARAWSINPYRRCGIGCVYCIARSQGKAEPWFDRDHVTDELRSRLLAVPPEVEVGVGALIDAYPPEEEKLGLTRLVLAELSRQKRPFCVNTKSDLVQRDIDILINHDGHCDVFLSLCSLDESVLSELEPRAPSAADRLRAVSALHHAGVDIHIDASPWIPGVSDIGALLDALPAGVCIQVAPLDIRPLGPEATIAGMRFTQKRIHDAYRLHRKAVGDNPRVRWKVPFYGEAAANRVLRRAWTTRAEPENGLTRDLKKP